MGVSLNGGATQTPHNDKWNSRKTHWLLGTTISGNPEHGVSKNNGTPNIYPFE